MKWQWLAAFAALFVGCDLGNPATVTVPECEPTLAVHPEPVPGSAHVAPSAFAGQPLGAGMSTDDVVFDDENIGELVGDGERVWAGGEYRYLSRQLPPQAEQEKRIKQFRELKINVIPRKEWPRRIKEQAEARARVSDFCDFPPFDQNGTNYCWANGPCQAATVMRRIQGLPLRILSSASIAGPITGYRNVGGWEINALEYLVKHGATTVDIWPANAISRQYNTAVVTADRVNFQALEWVECHTADEFATLALEGCPGAVAYTWWRHVVALCDLVEITPGKFGFRLRNSWGTYGSRNELGHSGFFVLAEGKGTPSSGFMLRQVTPSSPRMNAPGYAAPTARYLSVFTTTDGSRPCMLLERELKRLESAGWEVQRYDVAQHPELVKQMGVKSTPTTFVYLGERVAKRIEGFASANEIADRANAATLDKETSLFRRRYRGRCVGGKCSLEVDYAMAA